MLSKIKNFFVSILQIMIRSREMKAKAYVDYYKKHGYCPFWE